MTDATFEVVEAESGGFRWRLRSADTIIATSDGTYETKQAAAGDVQRVKHVAPEAGVTDAA